MVLACLAPFTAIRAEPPAPDGRLRTVEYHADAVVSLTAFVGYHVHIEFAPDERFITLASGDTAGVEVASEGNHLLLKPKRATAGTNVTLLTSRRTYFLDYRALARPPRLDEAVYSLRFEYPQDRQGSEADRAQAGLARQVDALPAAASRDYWYCGSPALRPVAAEDDGIQVRLRFAPASELPTIYAVAPDGAETLVNSHVENDTVIVHRLAARLILRRGLQFGCVIDRSAGRGARRPSDGVLQGDVRRRTVEIER